MTKEQEETCKDVLKRFVYKVRKSEVCQLIFHYYTDSDFNDKMKTYPVNTPGYFASFNAERTIYQIKKKILSVRNNYWNLEEGKIKLVESLCVNHPKEFENLKDYINSLWESNLAQQDKEFEKEEKELKEKDNAKLKSILKEKYNLLQEVVNLILSDTSEYPYKSDKIKVLLELELDVDTIFLILQTREKLISPRGYIDKYYKERQEGIKQRKIVQYELNSSIKHITNQLKGKNNN